MPEESISTPGSQGDGDAIRRLERRIESLEYAAQRENKWWRGGLIAALVLVALSILIAGHHRRHHRPPMMGMMGSGMMAGRCEGPRMMPYGPPPPPPYWGNGHGPQGGYGYYGPPEGWHHRHHDEGPGPEGEPSPEPKG